MKTNWKISFIGFLIFGISFGAYVYAHSKSTINLVDRPIEVNLTGIWNCNDGGIYYIRQVSNEIWWFGNSSNNAFSNVFHGQLSGSTITGKWSDVPLGKA